MRANNILVHICCSVDSHFFLQKLQLDFPQEKLIGFFYDPNIHPYSEYQLRLLDVKHSCKKLDIELIEGEYDLQSWLKVVEGMENEPEKGKRCQACFDRRFEVSAKKALEIGEKSFTSTLLVSPLKSHQQLKESGDIFYKKYGVEFVVVDYRANGGTQEQSKVTKEQKLYRQDYCGCIYGLTKQREQQNILMDEMFSPISAQILPASIEERLKIYQKRIDLEEQDIEYKIIKQRFLNYRLFSLKVVSKKDGVLDAHALIYSTLARKKVQGNRVKDEVIFITLDRFNTLNNSNYQSIKELIFNPPTVDKESDLRAKISDNNYDLTPIIVLDAVPESKLTVYLDAITYEDTKEKLIVL